GTGLFNEGNYARIVGGEPFGIACSGRQRATESGASAGASAGLGLVAGAGIERRLVDGDVPDVATVVEDVLRAVTVVDIPVDDRDPGRAVEPGVGGGDGDAVEQAEAHRLVRGGM